jgi:hypothetical protein
MKKLSVAALALALGLSTLALANGYRPPRQLEEGGKVVRLSGKLARQANGGRWDRGALSWRLDGTTLYFSDAKLLARAAKLEGRNVRVEGRFEVRRFVLSRLPDPRGGSVPDIARVEFHRVLVVTSIHETVAGIVRIVPLDRKRDATWNDDHLPRYQADFGGVKYPLDPSVGEDLIRRARAGLNGQALLQGHLRERTFTLVRRPNPFGLPVFTDARVERMTVLVVESLVPLELFPVPKAAKVEVLATVHYVGNAYSRLPNGMVIGTLRGYDYEGCYIVRQGRRIHLEFNPGMELVDQQNLGGKVLRLTGHFTSRPRADGKEAQEVFVVTSHRRA